MKLCEYLASGLAVVARHTPELGRRREPAVSLYDAAPELPSVLGRVLEGGIDRVAVSRGAEAHSWVRIGRRFLSFVKALPAVSGRQPGTEGRRSPRRARSPGVAR
jgi:hypothetical protein